MDLSARGLLTRVSDRTLPGGRTELAWANRPPTGLELGGATLPRALAEAHRRRGFSIAVGSETAGSNGEQLGRAQTCYPRGQQLPYALVESYVMGRLDDELIADYLNGLLALGCKATTAARWPAGYRHSAPAVPLVAAMLPFYGTEPIVVRAVANAGQELPAPQELRLYPRADWVPLLIAGGIAAAARDIRLRLKLAGCRPVVPDTAFGQQMVDGTRLAGALLLRVPPSARARSLTAVCAVLPAHLDAPTSEGALT
jgi:hypothetical protein